MLKTGDRVKFLNDVGGGKIVSFQSKNIVVVENEDGFEMPVMITELVKVAEAESYDKVNRDFSKKPEAKVEQKETIPEHKAELVPGNDDPKFYMAFYPTDQNNPVGGEIEIYFINNSNFIYIYIYLNI